MTQRYRSRRRVHASLLALAWLTLAGCEDGEANELGLDAALLEADAEELTFEASIERAVEPR